MIVLSTFVIILKGESLMKRKQWFLAILAAAMLCGCSENSSEQSANTLLTAPMVDQNTAAVATEPDSPIYSASDVHFSDAHVGKGYWLACVDGQGKLSQMTDVYHYPVIGDDAMVSVLAASLRDDGQWHWGASVSYADALNDLLAKGGEYALVAGEDIIYAVGEDNSVTVLIQISGVEAPALSCTFAEASVFGNVISSENMKA